MFVYVWIASVQFPEQPRVETVGLTRTAKACVPSVFDAEMLALKQTLMWLFQVW